MEAKLDEFWKFARAMKGPIDLKDAFFIWATDNRMSFETAEKAWKNINASVNEMFDKKADISISGPAEEMKGLLDKGTGELPIEDQIKDDLEMKQEEPIDQTIDEEETKTIVDSLEEPDEDEAITGAGSVEEPTVGGELPTDTATLPAGGEVLPV